MSLVVLGGQELDELEQWVSELFSAVPAGKGARPTFFGAGMPYQVHPHPLVMLCMLGPYCQCRALLQSKCTMTCLIRRISASPREKALRLWWSCMLVQQLGGVLLLAGDVIVRGIEKSTWSTCTGSVTA